MAGMPGAGAHGTRSHGTRQHDPRSRGTGTGLHGTSVELTHDEYRAAWHALGLGARHWNLDLPGLPEMTGEQRRIRAGDAVAGLRARGLADRRHLAPAVADPLHLLARPVREVNGWVRQGSQSVRLLAGARGDTGVLALLDAQRLVLHTGPAGGLCAAVARLLAERPAGPGTSVSVLAGLLHRPADQERDLGGARLEDRLTRGGTKPADARNFVAMLRGSKAGAAKFGAARRDRNGTRRPAPGVLVYLATERGGYTLQPSRGADGSQWTTLAPATAAQVEQRLTQLLNSAPGE